MPQPRNMLVSIIFRVVLSTALLVIAGGIYMMLVVTAPKPAASDAATQTPRVEVMQARPVPVRRQWEGFGTAAAMDAADVPARVTATVIERPEDIRAGRFVAAGDLLMRLDDTDFVKQVEISTQAISDIDAQLARLTIEEQSWTQRAQLAAEEVRLVQAEYQRLREALARDAARQREVDAVQRVLLAAQQAEVATREELDKIAPRRASLLAQRSREEASMRLARLNVERSRIVSPINGVLESVDVDVGENLTVGERVARVVSLRRIEVPLLLPASARPFVSVGDEVTLTDAGSTARTWQATISRISPVDDQSTRTLRVYAEVAQSGDGRAILPPGRFVRGLVQSSETEMRWVVPRRALSGERVLMINNGRVQSRNVEVDFNMQADFPSLGLSDQQWVVLKHPLPENSLVVLDGSRALAEGAEVVPLISSGQTQAGAPRSAGPDRDDQHVTIRDARSGLP